MDEPKTDTSHGPGCAHCAAGLPFDFTMAFQPILDLVEARVFAEEALVRGPGGESAAEVLAQVDGANRYRFDQACRVRAIELAAALGVDSMVSINFLPNAVYRPELCIRSTLAAAHRTGFPVDRIMFEVTENEQVTDAGKLREIITHYRAQGFRTAIDDFGAGYSNLALIAELAPDFVKLDMSLVRHIDTDRPRQSLVRHTAAMCEELGIGVIAEGIETEGELDTLRGFGVRYVQGYLFAKPSIGRLSGTEACKGLSTRR